MRSCTRSVGYIIAFSRVEKVGRRVSLGVMRGFGGLGEKKGEENDKKTKDSDLSS